MSQARRLGLLLGPLGLGWLALWLIPGLYLGHATTLLDGTAPESWKHLYVAGLYLVILGATARAWRLAGPRPGSPGLGPPRLGGLLAGLALGLAAVGVHRLLLAAGGWWAVPVISARAFLEALGVALLLAFGEEVLFRGYLFGVLREELGRPGAYLAANALFAVVHLLRPGSLPFKLACGLGLFLVGVLLCQLAEVAGTLWPAIGLHAGWIVMVVLEPPGRMVSGWLSGLEGDPAAGVLGWLLILVLVALVRWSGASWVPVDSPDPGTRR